MIEALLLNYIIQNKDLSIITDNNITKDYFKGWPEIFQYITEHRNRYGTIPSIDIVTNKFKDFEHFEVTDSPRFLIDEIRKQKKQYDTFNMLKDINKLIQDGEDIDIITKHMQSELFKINQQFNFNKPHDTVNDTKDRLEELEKRANAKGLIGITWGLQELDKWTFGILSGDVNTIGGLQGEGKSWFRKFIGVNAWWSGATVLDISLEMNKISEDWRWDTIAQNKFYEETNLPFSNLDLMSGKADIEKYKEYIDKIKSKKSYYLLTRESGLTFNPNTIRELIYQYEPDLVLLDHVALTEDNAGSTKNYARVSGFSREIKKVIEETQVKYIQMAQTDHKSINKNKDKEKDEGVVVSPGKTGIKYAQAIAEDSDRIINLKKENGVMHLFLDKNRHGKEGLELPLIWKINKGIVKQVGTGVDAF